MKIGIIGTGNMGGALLSAIACSGRYEVCAYNRGREKLLQVCDASGAVPMVSAAETVRASDVVILAVKPNMMTGVLQEIAPEVRPEQLMISIAVGLELSYYASILGGDKKLVRTMPNTPALVGEGMTAVCFGEHVTPDEKRIVFDIFSTAGKAEELPERLMNEVTALTGSSPAYVYIFIEAMADAAVLSGIPRAQAYDMAAQAVLGSAKMVLESGSHPAALKDAVCSPGGTTIRAVAELEKRGFRSAVIEAMNACTEASRAIGK